MQRNNELVSFPRQKEKKWTAKRLLFTGAIMLMCFLFIILGVYYLEYLQLSNELEKYNQRISKLEDENEALQEEIDRLQEEEYIEFIARRYLGLTKPN